MPTWQTSLPSSRLLPNSTRSSLVVTLLDSTPTSSTSRCWLRSSCVQASTLISQSAVLLTLALYSRRWSDATLPPLISSTAAEPWRKTSRLTEPTRIRRLHTVCLWDNWICITQMYRMTPNVVLPTIWMHWQSSPSRMTTLILPDA